ncbi:hypothetical protein YC2023_058284 [Brassica napus]
MERHVKHPFYPLAYLVIGLSSVKKAQLHLLVSSVPRTCLAQKETTGIICCGWAYPPRNYWQNTDHPPASSYGSFDSTSPYPPYDQHQSSGYSHAPHPPPSSAAAPSPYSSSSLYSAPPSYEKPVNYGQSRSDNYGDGVYSYQGGKIGLDGLRMLDPSTSRTLRIYPLENITRCETSVDIDAKRIRLQSNSYTTNTLLDTVTAAMFQAKEIGGSSRPPTSVKLVEQSAEKKKGLGDWINIIKPVNEEKDHWVPDEAASKCTSCGSDFGAFIRRHHCRNCGDVFCDNCTQGRIALTADENAPQVRFCDRCMAEVSQRLSNAKESASRNVSVQSHEDLARKLQEEMQKNRKSSSGSREGSGRRMKDVACPTCTVYLEVQVPISGSETIECGVCQNPFIDIDGLDDTTFWRSSFRLEKGRCLFSSSVQSQVGCFNLCSRSDGDFDK